MTLKYDAITEAVLYLKTTQDIKCPKCGTKDTSVIILGICDFCHTKTIHQFCNLLTDEFIWSKWFKGYIK